MLQSCSTNILWINSHFWMTSSFKQLMMSVAIFLFMQEYSIFEMSSKLLPQNLKACCIKNGVCVESLIHTRVTLKVHCRVTKFRAAKKSKKCVEHGIVNFSRRSLSHPAVIYVSLPQGKDNHQSLGPPICPFLPRAPPAHSWTQNTVASLGRNPAARPFSPPWSLRRAASFDSSYRASIQPEIKPWWENTGLDVQIDRRMKRQWCRHCTWGMMIGPGWENKRTSTGRRWMECVSVCHFVEGVGELNIETLPNLIKPDSATFHF